MNCRVCEELPWAVTGIFSVRTASGVCATCGAGVCREHGKRQRDDGRLMCSVCQERAVITNSKGHPYERSAHE